MRERRRLARSRTFYGGVMAFNARQSTMDCVVRDFSSAGAKVTFANPSAVPDAVELTIAHKKHTFRARVVWRRRDEAGVAFLEEAAAVPVPADWARRLRRWEGERAALRQRIADLSSGW